MGTQLLCGPSRSTIERRTKSNVWGILAQIAEEEKKQCCIASSEPFLCVTDASHSGISQSYMCEVDVAVDNYSDDDEEDESESGFPLSEMHESIDIDLPVEEEHIEMPLITRLKNWALKYSISLVALTALLSILCLYHPEVPKDARTLLRTKRCSTMEEKAGGQYFHFGILEAMKRQLSKWSHSLRDGTSLGLQINVDGLPLFRSSTEQFWPILGKLLDLKHQSPFVIGIFCGKTKPTSSSEFMSSFAADLEKLFQGFVFQGKKFTLQLCSVVCDKPARSFLKNVKGHNAFQGCDKCTQRGKYLNCRMSFPDTSFVLRTDASFEQMTDEDHHISPPPYLGPNVGFISNFPVDYMHLVCLGVCKKLLNLWIKGPLSVRLPSRLVKALSSSLTGLRSFIPSEFARKPRGLNEVDRWKATEYRQFLLYTGPVVLRSVLNTAVYNNYMLLFTGITILANPALCQKYNDYAQRLLTSFVQHFGEIYGTDLIVYNVHALLHLAEDVKIHGPLDSFSAFPYENYMNNLKNMIRKPEFPLAQAVRRLSEQMSAPCEMDFVELEFKKEHFNGPVTANFVAKRQFQEIHLAEFCLKLKDGDNAFYTEDEICLVQNIVQSENGNFIICKRFSHKCPFFSYPFDSTTLDIYTVSNLSDLLYTVQLDKIKSKCVLLPFRNVHIASPLIHFRKCTY